MTTTESDDNKEAKLDNAAASNSEVEPSASVSSSGIAPERLADWLPKAVAQLESEVGDFRGKLIAAAESARMLHDDSGSVSPNIVRAASSQILNEGAQRGLLSEMASTLAGMMFGFSTSGFWALVVLPDPAEWLIAATVLSLSLTCLMLGAQISAMWARRRKRHRLSH